MPIFRFQTSNRPLWLMLILSVFAWAPALHPGYWQALDGYIPAFNTVTLQRIAAIGVAPDLWRGEGVGAFFLPHLLFRLGTTPSDAVRVTFVIAMLAGAIGIYCWLVQWLEAYGAAFGGISYLMLPVLLATTYIRGDLADAVVLALLPWLLCTSTALAHSTMPGRRLLTGCSVGLLLSGLWLTQAGLALLATLLLVFYSWFVCRSFWSLGAIVIGAVAGAATLLPVLSQSAPPMIHFSDHFVYLFQLFRNQWQVAPSLASWQDQYPLQIGTIVIATSVLAIWLWAMLRPQWTQEQLRSLRFSLLGILLIATLSLTVSAPVWQWTGAERLLTYPWQLMLLAAPLLVILPATLPTLFPDFAEVPLWSALLLLTLANSVSGFTTEYTLIEPGNRPLAIVGNNQMAVLSAQVDESQPPTVTLDVAWQLLQPLSFDYNIFVQALSDESAQAHQVAQFDGPPLPESPATQWSYGQIFTATYTLHMPAEQPRTPMYIFGYYDWRDGSRLPIDGGKDDKIVVYSQNK